MPTESEFAKMDNIIESLKSQISNIKEQTKLLAASISHRTLYSNHLAHNSLAETLLTSDIQDHITAVENEVPLLIHI
jgi:uncharacterized protein YaaN involved in tellurite resistance